MASLLPLSTTFSSLSLSHHHKPPPLPLPLPPPPPPSSPPLSSCSSATQYLAINYQICYTKSSSRTSGRRGLSVVTHAGPSSTSYIFAFVFPLSLLAVTIFAASRVADKLDQQFLEELAINQEILEADEDYDGDSAISIEQEPAPAPPPRRNRPKREVESTST